MPRYSLLTATTGSERAPSFDLAHSFLRETILYWDGEQLSLLPDTQVRPSFLEDLNAGQS